ncbi:MAG: hypothetical protein ACE5G0_14170 [Rhodothermales bacterium]
MSEKTQSIMLGSAVVAVLSTSYLGLINCLCCAGVIIGAMVAVWHYTNTNELTIPTGEGAVMGLIAAVVGTVVAFVLNMILTSMGLGLEAAIQEFVLDRFGDQMSPEQLADMEEQFEASSSLGARLVNGVIGLAVSSVFGAIGGALGASLFKKGTDEQGEAEATAE